MNWQDLRYHEDYEICTDYPYMIRNRSNRKILSEKIDSTGYYEVNLNGKKYLKHRIIAEQWIHNDEPGLKLQVDHKNRDRTDNHIDNQRWISVSENNYNRSKYERFNDFVDDLPEPVIEVHSYDLSKKAFLFFLIKTNELGGP